MAEVKVEVLKPAECLHTRGVVPWDEQQGYRPSENGDVACCRCGRPLREHEHERPAFAVALAGEWPNFEADHIVGRCIACNRPPSIGYMASDEAWRTYGAGPAVLCIDCYIRRGGPVREIRLVYVSDAARTAVFARVEPA